MCGRRSGKRCEHTKTWGYACMGYCQSDADCPEGEICRLYGKSWYTCDVLRKDGGR